MNLRNSFPVSLLCRIAKIDRNNFYKWLKLPKINKYDYFDNVLRDIFNISDKTYGYRRMFLAIKQLGFTYSKKTVRKRMKILGLKCEIRQNKTIYKKYNLDNNSKCQNYLQQNFIVSKPNQKYSEDITYLPTKKGMVYLNVIIDLFGKIPIAYKSSYSCNSKLVEDTVDILLKKRKSLTNVIIHSDQGVTYLSKSYIEKLSKLKIIRSDSKKGCPYDNACSENFFSIFKVEKLYRLGYIPKDKEEMDEIIEEYMDFYINRRISNSLGGLTPKQYYDNYIEKAKRPTKIC